MAKLKKQLKKKFPKGDIRGDYLRSATFNFKDYSLAKTLKPVFIIEKTKLINFKEYINKDLYSYLAGIK